MIELTLRHIDETPDSTLSELLFGHHHLGFIIEDGYRNTKVLGETRIPAGRYEIIPRREGGFFDRYTSYWPGHSFVPWLIDVPGFEWILVHIGNFIADTRGCLLICTDWDRNRVTRNFYGLNSTEAYLRFYEFLNDAFQRNDRVFINVTRSSELPAIKTPEPILPPDPAPVREVPPSSPSPQPIVKRKSLRQRIIHWINSLFK